MSLLAGLVFVAARAPLHLSTFHLPLSVDDAIPMIQVHMLKSGQPVTTLINQPYNGTLDTYLLAPLTLVLSSHDAFRLYELLCAIAFVALIGALSRRLWPERPDAAWAAALLAAFGTPYMTMLTAIGPVPNFVIPLIVGAALLLLWSGEPEGPSRRRGLSAGLLTGLSAWNTVLTLPGLAGGLAGLLALRVSARRAALPFVLGCAVGYAPAIVSRVVGASGPSPAASVQPYATRTAAHWGEGLGVLTRAAKGLFGYDIALVVDGPERAALPALVRVLLLAALIVLVAAGVSRRALPLLGWGVALSAAFALSGRTEPHDVRYLYGLAVPVLVLAGAGVARLRTRLPPLSLALAAVLVGVWGWGHWVVLRAWRDPQHAARVWQVPDLAAPRARLAERGTRSAYASLQFAARLTVETDHRLIATQAWNERMPGDPMRYRDEVDLDPEAVWVLSTWLSRGMPRAGGFREIVQALGGRFEEDAVGDLIVFHGFVPPFDESRPIPARELAVSEDAAGALPATVLDRDMTTSWRSPSGITRGQGVTLRTSAPRRLSAIVLGVDLDRSPIGVPWVATVDGVVVATGPARFSTQWVDGVPRAGKQAVLTVVLPESPRTAEVRIVFQGAGPALAVSEVFAYGPDETPVARAGAPAAKAAFESARAGRWRDAVASYSEAARQEPERAGYHAALARARWRAAHRQVLDVESLDDGGAEVLGLRR
jgi:hypothetical protein